MLDQDMKKCRLGYTQLSDRILVVKLGGRILMYTLYVYVQRRH